MNTDRGAASAIKTLVSAITLRRVLLALGLAVLVAVALNPHFVTPFPIVLGRLLVISMVLLLAFTLAGVWQPPGVPRWLAQVMAVVLAAPLATFAVYLPTVAGNAALLHHEGLLFGYVLSTGSALVVAPLLAFGALTAYEQYAVQEFEQGAIDYLVKPFDEARLRDTVLRLQQQLARPEPAADGAFEAVLDRLSAALKERAGATHHLQWIKASVGSSVRLIPVEQVVYLRADEKYTLVVWEGGEALIRKTIRELADQLDPERFAQVHRSVIVNLHQVRHVNRGLNETAEVALKGRDELLPVSHSFVHLFRQMWSGPVAIRAAAGSARSVFATRVASVRRTITWTSGNCTICICRLGVFAGFKPNISDPIASVPAASVQKVRAAEK